MNEVQRMDELVFFMKSIIDGIAYNFPSADEPCLANQRGKNREKRE